MFIYIWGSQHALPGEKFFLSPPGRRKKNVTKLLSCVPLRKYFKIFQKIIHILRSGVLTYFTIISNLMIITSNYMLRKNLVILHENNS